MPILKRELSFAGSVAAGDMEGVFRNWRITFRWLGEDAIDIDFEDYPGG
jgi:hypothetical protein